MSRIGRQQVTVPGGVEVKVADGVVSVKGPKGTLEQKLHHTMNVEFKDGQITCTPKAETKANRKFHGLTRSLIQNMVTGVHTGFQKSLSLNGVGYRAIAKGKGITLTLGYSHPIEFEPPTGVELKVEKQTTILVSGADKQAVGQVAAEIRKFRPPEPYHGKGVRYTDERIIKKAGKAAGSK
jgi:large subunit ribosomal protein L6